MARADTLEWIHPEILKLQDAKRRRDRRGAGKDCERHQGEILPTSPGFPRPSCEREPTTTGHSGCHVAVQIALQG